MFENGFGVLFVKKNVVRNMVSRDTEPYFLSKTTVLLWGD
jgi:hypothetical protein